MNWTRGLPVALVAAFALAALLMGEMVLSVLQSQTSLNVVGKGAVVLLTGLAIAALVAIIRARGADPSFRGAFSELIRITAIAEVALVIGLWVMTLRGWTP